MKQQIEQPVEKMTVGAFLKFLSDNSNGRVIDETDRLLFEDWSGPRVRRLVLDDMGCDCDTGGIVLYFQKARKNSPWGYFQGDNLPDPPAKELDEEELNALEEKEDEKTRIRVHNILIENAKRAMEALTSAGLTLDTPMLEEKET